MNKIIIVHYEEDTDAIYAFKCAVEKLWDQHSEYSRSAMISTLADLEDISAVTERLMRNQEDIGNAIIPYYGAEAAVVLTNLLKNHISIAIDIFKLIKTGQPTQDLENAWAANADALATFLDGADSDNWPKNTVLAVLTNHLANKIAEARARFSKDWITDINVNDMSRDTTRALSNTFSTGIINKFPELFVRQHSSRAIKKK